MCSVLGRPRPPSAPASSECSAAVAVAVAVVVHVVRPSVRRRRLSGLLASRHRDVAAAGDVAFASSAVNCAFLSLFLLYTEPLFARPAWLKTPQSEH